MQGANGVQHEYVEFEIRFKGMIKNMTQHKQADQTLYFASLFHDQTTHFYMLPLNFPCFHAFEPYFKLHIFVLDPIGSLHYLRIFGARSLRGEYCYTP